jgi:hypothetical protein
LLNRGAGLGPNFDFVRQILPIGRNGPGRNAARAAIFAIAVWRQAHKTAVKGRECETSAYVHSHA